MNKQDIRNLFTQKVAELLAQGYTIHPDSMPGSQGEIAHIDLDNGSEIIRVLLTRGCKYTEEFYGDTVTLTVGKATVSCRGHWDELVWNQELDKRFEIEFAEIGRDFYTDLATAAEIHAKRRMRRKAKPNTDIWNTSREELGTAYKSIALRWLQKQPRMKSAKLTDIERMVRVTTHSGKRSFEISAKGRTFTLKP